MKFLVQRWEYKGDRNGNSRVLWLVFSMINGFVIHIYEDATGNECPYPKEGCVRLPDVVNGSPSWEDWRKLAFSDLSPETIPEPHTVADYHEAFEEFGEAASWKHC